MSTMSEAKITESLAKLAIFERDYPSSPCLKAAITIRHLRIACVRLRRLAASPTEAANNVNPPARKRRQGPKHAFGTPAHVKVLANIEVDASTGCWIWLGGGSTRYGTISSERTRNDFVHRVMFEHANSRRLKAGEVVRHICDNGFCCNPAHLLLGTQKENAQDRSARRRGGVQKLTQSDAKEILIRRREGESVKVLAIEYGVSEVNVGHIGRYSFKYLSDDPDVQAVAKSFAGTRKLTGENVREIKRRLANGEERKSIARAFNLTEEYLRDIAIGRRWRSIE